MNLSKSASQYEHGAPFSVLCDCATQNLDKGTDFVKIEFKVASNFGQEEHISKVQVEESGMLMWTEIPPSRLEIEELAGTEVDGQTEDADLHDLGPFWNAELRFKSFAVAIRGLEPNSKYTWRIAVANEVGWSCEKSEPFESHTVFRPATPRLLEAQRGPFEIRVCWDQPDPLGGAINLWDAQVRESSLFSTWSTAKDFVILRQPSPPADDAVSAPSSGASVASTPLLWEAAFGCLKPGVEYQLRLSTRNIAGWSDWSEPLKTTACGPPVVSSCTVIQEPSLEGWIVDVFLEDNPCRAFICTVDFECDLWSSVDGRRRVRYQTVARHAKHGNWQAHFPRLVKDAKPDLKATATVMAGNAAGWSKAKSGSFPNSASDSKDPKDERLTWAPKMAQVQLSADATSVVTEALCCLKLFLSTEGEVLSHQAAMNWPGTPSNGRDLKKCPRRDLQQETERFLSMAGSQGDRSLPLEQREKVLQKALQTIGSIGGTKEKEAILEKEAALKKASAKYATLWKDFWFAGSLVAGLLMDTCHSTWRRFREPLNCDVQLMLEGCLFVTLTKQSTMTAAQLLAVTRNLPSYKSEADGHSQHLLRSALKTDDLAASNVAISNFDSNFLTNLRDQTMRDLFALKSLRVACDHQLRKLQRALELLAVSAAGKSSHSVSTGGAHSFPEVTVTDKLSQTALGLILTMVMPVPGSVEVGVASIGALWLEGDSAGKHLVVEHPLPDDLHQLNPFGRFRQRARLSAERLIRSWAAIPAPQEGQETGTLLAPWLPSFRFL
eukprot:Skav205606  [mRNA]  locus=scaffold460:188526:193499:+ [translate_table: standard]